jgi:hypothetical protein
VGSIGDEDQDTFTNNFDYASLICAIRLRLADLHWLYTPSKFTKACGIVKDYSSYFAKQALKDLKDSGEEAYSGRYAFILNLYKAESGTGTRPTCERSDCWRGYHSVLNVLGFVSTPMLVWFLSAFQGLPAGSPHVLMDGQSQLSSSLSPSSSRASP